MPGQWELTGEIDVHVAAAFGVALHGALRHRLGASDGPDLHVDASRVAFVDDAGARTLWVAAEAAARGQSEVLHGASASLRELVGVDGAPRTLHFAPYEAH